MVLPTQLSEYPCIFCSLLPWGGGSLWSLLVMYGVPRESMASFLLRAWGPNTGGGTLLHLAAAVTFGTVTAAFWIAQSLSTRVGQGTLVRDPIFRTLAVPTLRFGNVSGLHSSHNGVLAFPSACPKCPRVSLAKGQLMAELGIELKTAGPQANTLNTRPAFLACKSAVFVL